MPDVPMPIFPTPWGRTEHAICSLVAAERNLTPENWRRHANTIIGYLDGRLEVGREPGYGVVVPEPKEPHGRSTARRTRAGPAAARG